MNQTAKEVIASGDVKVVVDYAIALVMKITALNKDLDELKKYLREEARKRTASSGARIAEIEGHLGQASVVFEKAQVRSKKGMKLADIEENLSAETFAKLFVTTVQVEPATDFLDKLSEVTTVERSVIDNFLEVVPTTPKVYLPK